MPNIEIIEHENAEGRLKEIYDGLVKSRGKIAEVHKIQSLNPETIATHMDLYMSIMFASSPLKRVQREMLAVVVSKANECEYCQTHHAEAVQHYWKDEQKTKLLRKDYRQVDLDTANKALCDMAWDLTKTPGQSTSQKHTEKLQKLDFSDRAILDATLVISYFNFVNRMVLNLGVSLEDNAGGYKY